MKRILLIEDEARIRENLALILTLEGYDVVSAPDGQAGWDLARSEPPDMVLCDIAMPILDGYGVLAQLREDPQLADTPFIFLTAKASLADLRTGMNLGADDYLAKPFKAEELLAAVEARLARAEVGARSRCTVPSAARLQRLGLTTREAEVLHWLAQGKSNPEIALILELGLATVKTHVLHIFDKLHVENRGAAALLAIESAVG